MVTRIAISIPSEVFERVTRRAAELGISHSEFFARAAERYLAELEGESLTDRINTALDATGAGDAELTRDVTHHSRHVSSAGTDGW